jgi:predicted ferric reductase
MSDSIPPPSSRITAPLDILPAAPPLAAAPPPAAPPPRRMPAKEQRSDAETAALMDDMLARYSWRNVLVSLILGVAVGVVFAWFILPTYLPGMVQSAVGNAPKAYWYLSRSAGVIAVVLVWLSVVWGLLLTTTLGKMLGQVASIVDIHRHLSWLTVVFVLVHIFVLLGDKYITYTVLTLFIPYADTAYRPFEVALGQIGYYAVVLVTVSFWVRRWIGQKFWRALHYLSFVAYGLVIAHAYLAGTDSPTLYWGYVASVIVVLFLTMLRIITAVTTKTAPTVDA